MMVLTNSTYYECQVVMWAKIVALGEMQISKNPFVWEKVEVNFPGTTTYECKCPWVYKERRYVLIAENLFVYVDYGQPIVSTEALCYEASIMWGYNCS